MPVPAQWDTQRDIQLLGFDPEPTDFFVESQGNQIVFWERALESGKPSVFTEEFEISILQKQWLISEDSVGDYNPSDPILAAHLGSTEYIQTNQPELQEIARSVVRNEFNPYIKARLLFDFVVDHMNGVSPGINDALGAFKARQGECGGYSHLFIALCRSVGVPARPVTGIVNLRDGEHHWAEGEVGTHVWAEFFLPNYGWVPADPTAMETNGIYALGVSYGNRLIVSKGSDIDLGHGLTGGIPWFHMPYVNGHQEEGEDITLTVHILDD